MALRIAGKTSSSELCKEASDAATQARKWITRSGGASLPVALIDADKHIRSFRSLCEQVSALSAIVPVKCAARMPLEILTQLISSLVADQRTPFQIPKLTQIENGLETAGAGKLVVEITSRKPDAKSWPSMFVHAWLSSALDTVSQQDPEVRGFMGSTHSQYVDDFTHLDEERIHLATDRVRRAHGERAIAAMNANPTGEQLIRAEATKMRRHMPLRTEDRASVGGAEAEADGARIVFDDSPSLPPKAVKSIILDSGFYCAPS